MSQEGNKWVMADVDSSTPKSKGVTREERSCPLAPRKSQPPTRYNDSVYRK